MQGRLKPSDRLSDSSSSKAFRVHVTRRTAAFSLVELLVTLALILILSVMLYGFGSRSHQQQQKKACQKNLQRIYVALQIFANEHGDAFPLVPGSRTSETPLDLLVPRYTSDTGVFICPGSKDSPLPQGESLVKRKISYAYFMGLRMPESAEALMSDKQVSTNAKTAGQSLFSTDGKPPGNNHHKYGGNVLFCDGRLEMCPPTAPFSLVSTQGVVLLNPKP